MTFILIFVFIIIFILISRSDCAYSTKVTRNFDWTYSTLYNGTLSDLELEPTDEKIDFEKLKVREEIKFYQEIYLYEDELDDNGSTKCTIKIVSVQ